jgi:[ribosomal protein S5]-alanine N-acetyltransferase
MTQACLKQCRYVTPRLEVQALAPHVAYGLAETEPLQTELSQTELSQALLKLLTPRVVETLPPHFSGIDTPERAAHWLAQMRCESQLLLVQSAASAEPVGLVFIHAPDEGGTQVGAPATWHLGYLLGEDYWGQGLASECLRGLIDWCRAAEFSVFLLAGVEPGNHASIRLLSRLGFHREGAVGADGQVFYRLDI